MRLVRLFSAAILWIVVVLCLAFTIVPRFLDARYYRGPVSGHFDGSRFANPDGDDTFAPTAAGPGGKTGPAPGFGMMARFLTDSDGRPAWPDHVTVHQIAPPARVMGQAMVATWVGHATVLVQTRGLNILTDPVWSNRAGPLGFGPARVAAPGIAFDRLPKIDLVLVSHDHYDHMDLPTLKRLWTRDKPLIVTSLGNDSVIGQVGVPATARDWGGRVEVRPGIDVIVTRGHHWGSRWFADRNRALWSSFVVTLPGGNLFFAGDTGAGDLRWADEAAAYGPVRLALIPIGAFRFTAGQMASGSHIGPIDAVEAYRRLGASTGIGVHWGTFRLSYEAYDTPPRLLAAVEACRGVHGFETIRLGQPTRIAPYARPAVTPVTPAAEASCLASSAVPDLR
ncbi:MBL fold metallo-hydrolase [Sphingomonas sp. BAUL-RG-20F-R05-02]|uniref:MBL fold metallo-hydrolase n=1 Tax=Sphingomonas sp. BAUL-RG-20F-R05-02 TaxID=2914830 RepID=UPI001F5853CC|nr:MBL fold metallo-hydrolase [Sphingomonas sp. BAUL-RG-20F-R05-02]